MNNPKVAMLAVFGAVGCAGTISIAGGLVPDLVMIIMACAIGLVGLVGAVGALLVSMAGLFVKREERIETMRAEAAKWGEIQKMERETRLIEAQLRNERAKLLMNQRGDSPLEIILTIVFLLALGAYLLSWLGVFSFRFGAEPSAAPTMAAIESTSEALASMERIAMAAVERPIEIWPAYCMAAITTALLIAVLALACALIASNRRLEIREIEIKSTACKLDAPVERASHGMLEW